MFVYLVLGLICTAVNEQISQLLALRAENLFFAIQGLFRGKYATLIAHDLYDHSLVRSMSSKGAPVEGTPDVTAAPAASVDSGKVADDAAEPAGTYRPNHKPSYIPSHVFSLALTDLLGLVHPSEPAPVVAGQAATPVKPFLDTIKESPYNKDGHLYGILRPLLAGAGDDIDKVRHHLELWYEATMERASGWYKKRIQMITFCVAFGIVLVANADSLMIFERLWANPAQRQILAGQAQVEGKTLAGAPSELKDESKKAVADLLGWSGPVNWNASDYKPSNPNRFPMGFEWFYKLIGLAITAFAASLGAPFWFDILNRFMNIRTTGASPGEKPKPPDTKPQPSDRIPSKPTSPTTADSNVQVKK
ncbi:hypothetical protein [Fimbriimonas ginsengisoli]|uniref:hypothetical protein n=1 Tax=Fimbriimonas ginsengisoli TaxID=1005039 RepID=UPI001186FA44|nr:hypothetical protein [Fimbriimonas ginsengisoli]